VSLPIIKSSPVGTLYALLDYGARHLLEASMSKGSKRRPTLISREAEDANWNALFGQSRLQKMVQDQEMAKAQESTPKQAPLLSVPTPQE
jgi:hypothetical protein